MRNKILAVVLGLTLCFGITGCGSADNKAESMDSGGVIVDPDTGVMYYQKRFDGGITPLYNADGTLRVYEGNTDVR